MIKAAAAAKPAVKTHGNNAAHIAALQANGTELDGIITKAFGGDQTAKDFLVATNDAGETPLHVATRVGSLGCARRLLVHFKNDPTIVLAKTKKMPHQNSHDNNEENTAAHIAAAQNNDLILAEFLNKFSKETLAATNAHDNTILHIAAREGCLHALLTIIKALGGNTPTARTFINKKNAKGLTALHLAAREGRAIIVHTLLDNGVDVRMETHGSNKQKAARSALDLAQRNLKKTIREKVSNEIAATQYRSIIRQLWQAMSIAPKDDELADIKDLGEDSDTDSQVFEPKQTTQSIHPAKETTVPPAAPQASVPAFTDAIAHAKGGKRDAMTTLLRTADRKMLLSTKDKDGYLLLHHAAENHKPLVTQDIIDAMKADNIDLQQTVNGKTAYALAFAADHKNPDKKVATLDALTKAGITK